jgi:hypothetical protein
MCVWPCCGSLCASRYTHVRLCVCLLSVSRSVCLCVCGVFPVRTKKRARARALLLHPPGTADVCVCVCKIVPNLAWQVCLQLRHSSSLTPRYVCVSLYLSLAQCVPSYLSLYVPLSVCQSISTCQLFFFFLFFLPVNSYRFLPVNSYLFVSLSTFSLSTYLSP